MDGTATKMKTFTPKPLAELLPGLRGILSKESMRTLSEMKMKPPRSTMGITRTSEKAIKPLTLAEMRPHLLALNVDPGKCQPKNSVKKSGWNSSVKVEKTVSHTANGQLKNHSVRKVLSFQPKPKTNVRATVNETPKFPRPEVKAKKALQAVQVKNDVRISGVYKIPETPTIRRNPVYKNRMTLANKENELHQNNAVRKQLSVTPKQKLPLQKKLLSDPDTPLSNMSWKSSGDASFLRVEKDIEEKAKDSQKNIIKNVDEIAQQVSTPFKEYRNVQEFFNNTDDTEDSMHYNDNTIMCFDKPKICNDNSKRDESVIVSLCNLLDKATVNKCEKGSTEYKELLLHVEKQTVHNIEMIDNEIKTLTKIKKSQQESLQIVRKLIKENLSVPLENKNETVTEHKTELMKDSLKVDNNVNEVLITSKTCSVIKSTSKLPSYKIPKKNLCLWKKVFHKSMPNVSNGMRTPTKDTNNKALDIYMVMKEQMNFLNTPLVKCKKTDTPSTPAVTSQNLQLQLDKLYNGSS